MLAEVHQDVDQRVPYGARRGERAGVIAICQHSASPTERAVHDACQADGEAADAARECAAVIRLRDQMNVVVLHAEFDHLERGPRGCGERAAHYGENSPRTKAMDGVDGPERHVHGVCGSMLRAATVRHSGPAAGCELSSGTVPPTTPRSWCGKRELCGMPLHLDWATLSFYLSLVKCAGSDRG